MPLQPRVAWAPVERQLCLWNDVPALSARRIAELTGISSRQVVRHRVADAITLPTLELIADELGVHPSELTIEYIDVLISAVAA